MDFRSATGCDTWRTTGYGKGKTSTSASDVRVKPDTAIQQYYQFHPPLSPARIVATEWPEYLISSIDNKIILLHAREMTVREIQAHLSEMYGKEVSPSLI